MICFRYEGGNQRSLTMLREKDQDIQIRVSDEEKEESCQQPAGVIRPSQQQQTPQNRLGRLALKKGERDISKNWTDDEIEILINLCVPFLITNCKNITTKMQYQKFFSLSKINF